MNRLCTAVAGWAGLTVLATGCGGSGEGTVDAGSDFVVRSDRAALARSISFPGGGTRMTVRLETETGAPRTDDETGALSAMWADSDQAAPIAVRGRPITEPGHTVVLWMPADNDAQLAVQRDEIRQFVITRQPGERLAVYRWSDQIEQLADFSGDPVAAEAVLDAVAPRNPAVTLAMPSAALRDAAAAAYNIEGDTPTGMRAVVIVADHLPGPVPDVAGQSVVVQWVIPQLSSAEAEALGTERVAASIDDAAEALAQHAASAFYDLGLCGAGEAERPWTLSVARDRGELSVMVPAALPEWLGAACDVDAIVDGHPDGPFDVDAAPWPDSVELVFTPNQRAVYETRTAQDSKADFDVSLRFAPGRPTVAAVAHLRGQGSLYCARRSYTVNIKGPRSRHLMPGSGTDELYLLSMCLDDRYVRAYTVYQLLAELGLFAPKFRFIEVKLDGQSRGVYMFVEKPAEEIVRDHGGVAAVIRRRFDPFNDRTVPDVKYTRTPAFDAVAAYQDILASTANLAGDALATALDERLDLDAYMALLAFHSLTGNGDHVDEMWLYATDRLAAGGTVAPWFAVMGWDPDDIFASCHYSGMFAFADAYGLSSCAEAELDDLILSDPVLYPRYAGVLEAVMNRITPARFRAALDATGDGILPYMRRPEIAAAMVRLIEANPAAADPVVAEAEIVAALDALQASFEARHAVLQSRLAAFWAAQ